jgi:hypothetical protein
LCHFLNIDDRKNVSGPIDLLLAFNTPGRKKLAHTKLKEIYPRISVATRLGFIFGQIRIKREKLFISCLFYDVVEGRKKLKRREAEIITTR